MVAKKESASKSKDAIEVLIQQHKEVQKMFKDFEKLKEGDEAEKAALVKECCANLKIHAQIEEEIFYPAAREALRDGDDLLDEAEVEHASVEDLITQLEGMTPGDDLYDAKFTVLGEYTNHHIKEEQDEMFPKVKKAKLDLGAIGKQLEQRTMQLKGKMGLLGE
ncbi:MAG: hemerythrin domain-containing protein [Burkholderiales bacterium]|nr:hemerythrin domain-containing protein [Burkholderiales bacterium]MBA3768457.1 hemerythrin domain-containing protein [Acidobacteriota bacterium]